MNAASTLALVAAGASLYAAAMAARFSRAPGWSAQKWFGLLSLLAATYAAADLVCYLPGTSDGLVTALSRAQVALAAAQAGIWLHYSDVQLRRPPGRRHTRIAAGLAIAGLPGIVPGVAFTERVVHLDFGSVSYPIPLPTPVGEALMLAVLLAVGWAAWRFAAAGRRGAAHAWLHAAGLAILAAAIVNDELVMAGAARMPLLADLGIVAAIGGVGLALAGRFVDEARDLHRLRERLEEAVAERTGALAAREADLSRAGQLAALGRLAAGVAHEIAGPAAAAASNVRQLARDMRLGIMPADTVACLDESEEALARIARTLRMLHDAERVALSPGGSREVALAKAVEEAIAMARVRGPCPVEVAIEVPDGLTVTGEWHVVTEVLALVLSQARWGDAGGPSRLTLRAEPAGERVRLEVERAPAAAWPAPDLPGEAGLGLAVARGLTASLGGTLEAEAGADGRLRVVLELPAGYT